MEQSKLVSQELWSLRRGYHGSVFQVAIAEIKDAIELIPIVWEACFAVNQEDLDGKTTVGDIQLHNAERRFYDWMNRGDEVRIAWVGQEIVGLLVTHAIGDKIGYIRLLYTKPEFEGLRVGKGLVDSVRPKRLVFRTRRDTPPLRCLAITSIAMRVCQSKNWDLWSMEWRM